MWENSLGMKLVGDFPKTANPLQSLELKGNEIQYVSWQSSRREDETLYEKKETIYFNKVSRGVFSTTPEWRLWEIVIRENAVT